MPICIKLNATIKDSILKLSGCIDLKFFIFEYIYSLSLLLNVGGYTIVLSGRQDNKNYKIREHGSVYALLKINMRVKKSPWGGKNAIMHQIIWSYIIGFIFFEFRV